MKKTSIKIAVPPTSYAVLRTLGQTVVLSMTGNLNFSNPQPLLNTIQSGVESLSDAIVAWGTPGHRGSHQDLVNLRVAANTLRNLLIQEAGYITNLVDLNSTPEEQAAFILSSGMQVKNQPQPQGVLQAPQNLRQLFQENVPLSTPKLKWAKPLNLNSAQNVKLYHIYRGATSVFANATFIGFTTKTFFIDENAPAGTTQYYFVCGTNGAGLGVATAGVLVMIPA